MRSHLSANSLFCGKCGREYSIPQIRFCPHPKTNRESGAHICYLCCCHCAFSSKDHLCGAINCDVFKINRCTQGVFWIIDGKLVCSKEPPGIPRKRHKKEWESLPEDITQGKPYNAYPMGRVDLRYNKAVIYLQPVPYPVLIEARIAEEFNLTNVIYQTIYVDTMTY